MAEGDLFDDRVTSSTNVIFQSDNTGDAFDEDYTKVPQWWDDQEDIVISGLSGRFPESDNVEELMENLYAGVDMVTEDSRRWDPGYYGLPKRHGKIKDLSKFDAEFFGFNPKQATDTDPQIRLLLQTAYECLYDAGVNPFAMRGTKSGIFLGNSLGETPTIKMGNLDEIHGEALNGTMSLAAYHLVYHLDFKGPCMTVDAACSSSLLALQLAVDAIRTGQCDQAIVAGAHLTLSPNSHLGFMALGMLSPQGKCHSFDIRGDGYVRGECVGCIFIQKKSLARRNYATILHAKSNTDGFKEQGISFPSAGQQINLLRSTYKEAGLNPGDVKYVEAHGTGTKVGDPIECHAIKTVFAQKRDEPLLIGSVKSNTGHAEPASGILGLAKVIIAMEKGIIPKNLHFSQANPYIPSLTDGSLKVVSENTTWEPGLVGVSSFGFGGSNTHIILKANTNAEKLVHFDKNKKDLPILLIHSSRTHDALDKVLTMFEKENSDDLYLYNLLCEQSATPTKLFPYRGFTIINRQNSKKKPIREIVKVSDESSPPIWFVYSGIGSQWIGMGKELMTLDIFREAVSKCSLTLEQFGINLIRLIMEGTVKDFKDNPLNSLICITAIQIAFTDLLRFLGIKENGIVGYSTGEIAASYADGCTDYNETMLIAYHVGKTILDSEHPPGGMAQVYLTLDQVIKRLPEGIFVASKDHNNSVTIAGNAGKVTELVNQLNSEGHVAKPINSAGVAFHSPHLQNISEQLRETLSKALPSPKTRTQNWISSSIRNEKLDTHLSRYSSADFHVNNLVSMMNLDSALKRVPTNAILIEISPDCVMQDLLKRGLTNKNIGLMSSKLENHENNIDFFVGSLGKLYQCGANFEIQKLYPKVEYPIPRGTPMLSNKFGWKHDKSWKVYCGTLSKQQTCVNSFVIDPFASDSKDHYILHHIFDGRPLYPFCGHIFMAWKTICKVHMLDYNKTPVRFENIKVIRATFVTKPIKFDVVLTTGNGDFEILEDGNLCASGRIVILDEEQNKEPFFLEKMLPGPIGTEKPKDRIELNSADIYKEFLLRGYEYGPTFRGIQGCDNENGDSTLLWTGNWVTFIDCLFQMFLVIEKQNSFFVPVRLRHLRIDPIRHNSAIQEIDGTKVIPGKNILELWAFIAGGVEACGLVSQTVRRRTHQQKITFERNSFVPFLDDHCLSEYPEIQKQLHLYNNTCRSLAINGIKRMLTAGTQLPNQAIFEKIATQANGPILKERIMDATNKFTEKESSLLTFLNGVLTEASKSGDVKSFLEKLSSEVNSPLTNLDQDKVWNFSWTDCSVITPMDIAIRNTKGFIIKVAVLEPESLMVTKKVNYVANLNPLIEPKFLLIGPEVEKKFTPEDYAGVTTTLHSFNVDEEQEMEGMEKNQDVIVLDRLLHKKQDIQKYLGKVRQLLRDDGFALVNEVTGNYEAAFFVERLQLEFNLPINGIRNNYEHGNWLATFQKDSTFPSNGFRKYGLYYEHRDWCDIFEKAGFHIISWSSEQLMTTLYLLRKIPSFTLDPLYLKVDNDNEFTWIEPLQKAIEDRLNEPPGKTIVMYNNEDRDCGILGMGICLKDEYKHNKTRSLLDLSLKNRTGPPAFNISDPEVQKLLKKDLLFNVYRDGVFGTFKHIPINEGQLYAYEETEHAFVNNLIAGDLSSVSWLSSDNKYFEERPKNEILSMASLYYSPLNFRDIMLASGRLPPDAIPKAERLDFEALLGCEFCGRLTKTGKRVMGLSTAAQGLATTLVVDSRFTFDVPDEWTMEEAATVPLAYSTAFYSLMVRGKMRHGERVLIHSGSGAVGISSITVALAYNCEVFTTVGNDEKKAFLLNRFPQLDEKHIMSSRNCDFELHIMQMTGGHGVDIVLNSLSDDKLQASVRCLAQNGRFLEIGKFDLSINASLGMSLFLKNASFHGVLLDSLTAPVFQPDWLIAVDLLVEHAKRGIVKPLPATIFEMNQQVEAFRYMAQGKHIGKVMLKIRDEEPERMALPKPVVVKAVMRATCHPQHVYIILGGLGGFGLELASWMVSRGCTKLIITSRNGIKTGYQARLVNAWRENGVSCTIFQADVSDKNEASRLMKEALAIGPIGGIFNLAMVLNDTVFENSSVKNFQVTFAPKYHVTKNIDELTRKMCGNELKWFVLFSSVTASRGNTGQTAYAFSNSASERIIEQRRNDGLCGNVVQWGVVGDVGVIMETLGDNSSVIRGTLPQRMASCLQIMDSVLCLNYPMVSSFVKSEVESTKIGQDEDVGEAIARILGISDLANINPDVNLGDLGLDSLMAIEIKQSLERDFDLVLTLKDMRTMTLAKLRDLAKAGKNQRDQTADSQPAVKVVPDETNGPNFFGQKFRIDFNTIRPEDPCKKINDVTEGVPLFFVHPIEGVATNLVPLAKLLPYPCYCFQLTPDAPMDSIENLSLFYVKQMMRIQSQGPYRIIGYSYGACIAFEMATQLQHKYPDNPKIIESLIMLDASHQYWKYFRQAYRRGYNIQSENLLNDPLFETEILVNFLIGIAPMDYEATKKKFLAMASFDERLNTVVDLIVSSGFIKDRETVRYGFVTYWKKMMMADTYNPKLKFNGNIMLIRAKASQIIENTIGKDYGLTEVSSGPVSTFIVEGDHDSFIHNNGAKLCADHIVSSLSNFNK